MKKNIVTDKKDKIIKEIIINENAILQYRETNINEISAVIRYIENNSIKEIVMYKVKPNKNNYSILINYNNTAVALFNNKNNKNYLERLYDLEEHRFFNIDDIDLAFKEKYPNIKINNELILTKN